MSIKELLLEIRNVKLRMIGATGNEAINLAIALIELQSSLIHKLLQLQVAQNTELDKAA